MYANRLQFWIREYPQSQVITMVRKEAVVIVSQPPYDMTQAWSAISIEFHSVSLPNRVNIKEKASPQLWKNLETNLDCSRALNLLHEWGSINTSKLTREWRTWWVFGTVLARSRRQAESMLISQNPSIS